MSNNGSKEVPQSAIVITFAAPGAADFSVQVHNAGPAQMLAAAEWLRLMAERAINARWAQEEMMRAKNAQEMAQVQQVLRGRR